MNEQAFNVIKSFDSDAKPYVFTVKRESEHLNLVLWTRQHLAQHSCLGPAQCSNIGGARLSLIRMLGA